MKKLLVIMFIFIVTAFSEMLKINATDESAEIPCANQIENAGNIRLDLYDITGKLITNMFNGYLIAGNHKFNLPLSLTNGIYFIRQISNGVSFNHKLIIQK